MSRLAHAERDEREREKGGDDSDPKDSSEPSAGEMHEEDRQQGSDDGADGIESLTQAEARAAQVGGSEVGDQGVAGRSANALADAIDEPGRQDPSERTRQRKQRLGASRQPVSGDGEPFAVAHAIRQRA